MPARNWHDKRAEQAIAAAIRRLTRTTDPTSIRFERLKSLSISVGGELVDFVPMPDRFTTNIAFGGERLPTAYIMLSQTGRLVSIPWPHPGLPLNFLSKKNP